MAIKNKTFKMSELKWKEFQNEDTTYYYIHRHIKNFEKDEAMAIYQNQKEINYKQMRRRYQQTFLENITIDSPGLQLLNAAMSEEDLISTLDEEILNILNERISSEIDTFKLDKLLYTAYSSLDKWFANPKSQESLKNLNDLFSATAVASYILANEEDGLFPLLLKTYNSGAAFLEMIKAYTENRIHMWEGRPFNMVTKRILSTQISIKKLVDDLNNPSVSKATLQGYIRNIFSSQVGEYVVSKAVVRGLKLTKDMIEKSFTGANTIVSTSENFQQLLNWGQSRTTNFKTDNYFPNVKIKIAELDTDITINLGISTKWYKLTQGGEIKSISVMNEANLSHRLNQLFSGAEGRYYAFNAMALVNQDGSIYASFKAALLSRFADLFISGFGSQGDFSQYIVINGKFYSILQLILAMEYFNDGQGSSDVNGGTDPITLSVVGLSKIAKETDDARKYEADIAMAYFRSRKHNLELDQLKITANFYPSRLTNLVKILNIGKVQK